MNNLNLREIKYSDISSVFRVYSMLADLEYDYPDFNNWFFKKVVSGLSTKYRRIFTVCKNHEMAAVLIIKDSESEKKICTLRVFEKFRNKGIGTFLLDVSRQELKTDYPLITLSESKIDDFAGLFKKFDFNYPKIYRGYYRQNTEEYCFNGMLYRT